MKRHYLQARSWMLARGRTGLALCSSQSLSRHQLQLAQSKQSIIGPTLSRRISTDFNLCAWLIGRFIVARRFAMFEPTVSPLLKHYSISCPSEIWRLCSVDIISRLCIFVFQEGINLISVLLSVCQCAGMNRQLPSEHACSPDISHH